MIQRFAMTGLVLAMALSACDKDQEVSPDVTSLTSTEDVTTAEYLLDDIEQVAYETVDTRDPNGPCAEITFKNPQGEFPNTITIDFGDGCTGPRGHVRSGTIVIEQSAPMYEDGASRTITFEDFFVDDIGVEGYIVLTNQSSDADDNMSFMRYSEIELTFPNGQTASHAASIIKTQIAGGDTDEFIDDVFEITGEASGFNRLGYTYEVVFVEPVIKEVACRWPVSGIVSLQVATENGTLSRSIDYGFENGACDNLAEVTLADGTLRVVKIHRRWW